MRYVNDDDVLKVIERFIGYLDEDMILRIKMKISAIPTAEERPHGEWIPCSERLPEENICDDGYVEPSDYVLVFGDHGNYGVSRYWGNRRTKKTNPHSFPDWMDLEWFSQKPIAWMPLPEPYKKEGDMDG